ncbi:MAG: hypothetical protein Q9195_007439 [Heterodermia aff. obscurata]
MAETHEGPFKKPLYVFDLPKDLLSTLHLKSIALPQSSEPGGSLRGAEADTQYEGNLEAADRTKPPASCQLCGVAFQNVSEQRHHIRSDWHGYNLKQKLKGLRGVDEAQFDKLVEDLDESISGSEESESETDEEKKETTLSAVLKRQAKLHHDGPDLNLDALKKSKRSSGKPPLLWFTTPLLPQNTSLGVYRVLFTEEEQNEESCLIEGIRQKQISPTVPNSAQAGVYGISSAASTADPHIFMCMIGGGHFAAMIVSLAPIINKKHKGLEERQARVIAHKTFHRYTTRRKQGGSQSANDSAKGAAKSAGASIRRHNEMALESEIRALLTDWKELIDKAQLIFTRATGSSNRKIIFGPYDGQVLKNSDSRNRTFPFSTRRATQAELMRAFVELTRVKVSEVDEEALAAAAAEKEQEASGSKAESKPLLPKVPKATKEDEAALLHTSQLQALIRRTKAPAILAYLTTNNISADFEFQPSDTQANHHAPTPLHLASSINSPVTVYSLLTKAAASPLKVNGEGKVAFDLAGDRATRDAFRVARSELGEGRWDWNAAHCPPALSKAIADKREKQAKAENEKGEAERRRIEIEHLKQGAASDTEKGPLKKASGKALGTIEKTGAEKREEEARGMTPEMRMRLERERRARAAEERVRRMANGTNSAGAGR